MEFEFKGFSLECHLVAGEVLFLGLDVTGMLGYANSARAIKLYTKKHHQRTYSRSGKQGGRPALFLTISGVIKLALSSSLDTAAEFQEWVTDDVVPEVILHGAYINPDIKPEQKERVLARLMEMPRASHPLFGSENMDKVAAFLKCSRNSPKLANWMWQFVYDDLNAEERAYLNKHNPVKSNGHRKHTIHAWLEENTMFEHKAHFDAILLLIELSQTEAEFMELYQQKFKRAFQITSF